MQNIDLLLGESGAETIIIGLKQLPIRNRHVIYFIHVETLGRLVPFAILSIHDRRHLRFETRHLRNVPGGKNVRTRRSDNLALKSP